MPHAPPSPPTPQTDAPSRRPASTWVKLLAVWAVGLCVWGLYFWISILVLIRLSS
jgi:uncharacterized RDD family membrane protein YckC